MAFTHSERCRVYLDCRAIFKEQRATLRKPKKIRQEIEGKSNLLPHLLRDIGVEKTASIALELLSQGVFESEARAKQTFPDLYQSAAGQDAKREKSEAEAIKKARETIQRATEQDMDVVDNAEDKQVKRPLGSVAPPIAAPEPKPGAACC